MNATDSILLPNEPTLIAACSGRSARFWRSTSRRGDWQQVAEFEDDEASRREQELVSDRPGRAFDSLGGGRHAMEPPTRARDQARQRFAHRIGEFLSDAVATGEARHIVLLAGPKFLGLLREELSQSARQAVFYEASKTSRKSSLEMYKAISS